MNSKQRSYLMKLASNMDAIIQIGKAGLTPEMTTMVDEALEARELIKLNMLKNCFDDGREVANMLAERTHAQVVTVIGRKIILYRESRTKKKIELPL